MNIFWEVIASNALVATALAIGTALVSRFWKNSAAIHLLWALVLVKLITPPVFSVPLAANWLWQPAGAQAPTINSPTVRFDEIKAADGRPAVNRPAAEFPAAASKNLSATTQVRFWGTEVCTLSNVLLAIWISGSAWVGLNYSVRIGRFRDHLQHVEPPPEAIAKAAKQLAQKLGLSRVPSVAMTSCTLPPLVWSMGRRPQLILPTVLFNQLNEHSRAAILAHELAHVSRRDYLVRLLELASTTLFWWHPVVWIACRQLRDLEDLCCDSLAVELVPNQERAYATALVDTLEFLSGQPRMLAPLPTAMLSSGSLSKRIEMLTQKRTNRLNAFTGVIVASLAAAPLVIGFAAEEPPPANNAHTKKFEASAPILHGRVTSETGAPLADTRVRVAYPATNMRFIDTEPHPELKQWDTKTDANGEYRLELPAITKPGKISVDAMKPGYRTSWGTLMRGGNDREVEVAPGKVTEETLKLPSALYLKGIVVNELGKPLSGVEISANADTANASGGVEQTKSNADGTFEIFNYPVKAVAFEEEAAKGVVNFFDHNYVTAKIEDIYKLPEDQRDSLRIVLPTGYDISGRVVSAAGKPIDNVLIKATYEKDWHLRKATMTDDNGKFVLRGLPGEPGTLSVHSLELKQKIKLPIALSADKDNMEVRLEAIPMTSAPKKVTVLGMQLADLTPELRAAFDLDEQHGAIVLDPGKDSERLGIGKLAEGDDFWMVGEKRIDGLRDFIKQILAEADAQKKDEPGIRVVYTFSRLDFDGTNTQHMKLTKDDLAQLQKVLDELPGD